MYQEYSGELLLMPCPTVLVTSKNNDIENVFTVSWIGIASSHPEYVCIAINTKRLSYSIIKESKRFCIGIPDDSMVETVDFCGNNSGRDVDKFSACHFTKSYISDFILINECKMHILCEVSDILDLGSHHLFVAKVLKKLIDEKIEANIIDELKPIAYYRPDYCKVLKMDSCYNGFTNPKEEDKK